MTSTAVYLLSTVTRTLLAETYRGRLQGVAAHHRTKPPGSEPDRRGVSSSVPDLTSQRGGYGGHEHWRSTTRSKSGLPSGARMSESSRDEQAPPRAAALRFAPVAIEDLNQPGRKWRQRYEKHIASPEWAATRQRVLEQRGSRCEACGSRLNLHVHHGTYDRLGEELDDDLFVLCGVCHVSLHEFHRRRTTTLWESTLAFLERPKYHPSKPKTKTNQPDPERVEADRKNNQRGARVIASSHTPAGWKPRNQRGTP